MPRTPPPPPEHTAACSRCGWSYRTAGPHLHTCQRGHTAAHMHNAELPGSPFRSKRAAEDALRAVVVAEIERLLKLRREQIAQTG